MGSVPVDGGDVPLHSIENGGDHEIPDFDFDFDF